MERYLSKASVRPEIAKKRHTAPGGIDTGTRRRSGSRLEQCPLCGRSFHIKQIISHAATCTGSPAVPVVAAFGSTGGSAPATTSDSVASSSTIAVSGQRCSTTTGTVVAKKQESIVSLLSREDPGAVRPPSCLMLPQLETPALPGQYLVPNFITKAEEADLLAFLDCPTTQPPWKPSTVGSTPRSDVRRYVLVRQLSQLLLRCGRVHIVQWPAPWAAVGRGYQAWLRWPPIRADRVLYAATTFYAATTCAVGQTDARDGTSHIAVRDGFHRR